MTEANIESIVEKHYRALLGPARRDQRLDLRRRLVEEDGVSSLQLVTFVTMVCEDAGVPLTALTEQDIVRMKTAGDVVAIIQAALHKEHLS